MDLTTRYMGMMLKNPIVPSASPLSRETDTIKRLEDAGAAAMVMHSIFEEQLAHEAGELDHYMVQGTESYGEAVSYFPQVEEFRVGPDEYLDNIRRAKDAVDMPIIGSLNGSSLGGWVEFARKIQQAGADGLELNVYVVNTDACLTGRDVEKIHLDILREVKKQVDIPVAMKLSPFYSSLSWMARQLDQAGADGLVLFNRFYQPDIDLEKLEVVPSLILSTPFAMRLPLRWVAILHGYLRASLAASSGIASATDAIKILMAGADVAMVCSVLLRQGVGEVATILSGMREWLEENEYESVAQMKGSMSHRSCPEPAAFERANYMKALNEYV